MACFSAGPLFPSRLRGVSVPWWLDVAAAGLVACCFPVFFSMPHRSIGWAALAGAIGHGARWLCIAGLGWSMPAAALVDCLLVAAILAPVCFHKHLPLRASGSPLWWLSCLGCSCFALSRGSSRLRPVTPVSLPWGEQPKTLPQRC